MGGTLLDLRPGHLDVPHDGDDQPGHRRHSGRATQRAVEDLLGRDQHEADAPGAVQGVGHAVRGSALVHVRGDRARPAPIAAGTSGLPDQHRHHGAAAGSAGVRGA
uniref:(northern house mosquito) hypothetical protein n=1 Tax=Culex pipiens TaxID=7175 RepID=A0A8D8AHM0_CULPI